MIITIILVSQNEVTAFRRLQKTIHICESTSIPNFQKTKKIYVELTGIEPATSWMQIRRSPNWATAPKLFLAVDQVGLRGLEPRTSSLSEMRSNHLSYKPKKL